MKNVSSCSILLQGPSTRDFGLSLLIQYVFYSAEWDCLSVVLKRTICPELEVEEQYVHMQMPDTMMRMWVESKD